jgi:hypothetical protein
LTHTPEQTSGVEAFAHLQALELHVVGAVQWMPQPPQLLLSLASLTHPWPWQ